MKVGDTVRVSPWQQGWPAAPWKRLGLVLGFRPGGYVLVYWGEDFPCEEEYPEQLEVM